MKINPDKIRDVIGSGGKIIQKIVAETGAKIDIEDDGTIYILAVNSEAAYEAKGIIDAIVFEPVEGCCYNGTVTRIIPIGAFVEIAPGKEGLVHISQLDKKRVAKVEDVVSIGDTIKVIVSEIDEKGRLNLSRKDALDVVEDI
jgi:polyribonucleotide nucleotidyltransferase